MREKLNKIAAVLALVIGGMTIFAGSRVLVGVDPGYHVINWVPLYNYTTGVVTVIITAGLLWKTSRWATTMTAATLAAHSAVMAILQTAYRDTVASESIEAMTMRIVTWIVILGLMFAKGRSAENLRTQAV